MQERLSVAIGYPTNDEGLVASPHHITVGYAAYAETFVASAYPIAIESRSWKRTSDFPASTKSSSQAVSDRDRESLLQPRLGNSTHASPERHANPAI
jgi:hypothetical protein